MNNQQYYLFIVKLEEYGIVVREEWYPVVGSVNPVFDGRDRLAPVKYVVDKAAGMTEAVECAGIAVGTGSVRAGVIHSLLQRSKMARLGSGIKVAHKYHHALGVLDIIRFAYGAHLFHHQV